MSTTPPPAAAAKQSVAIAGEDWTNKPRSPFKRLVPAIMLSQIGFYIAVLTPLPLLLTLHLTVLARGAEATAAFSVVTGFGALVALLFNPVAGCISDRTVWRFGRRRPWIIAGAIAGSLALVAIRSTTEVWQVVALWCVVQACFNFQYAGTNAVVADQVPPARRGGVSGLVGLTIAIGPPLGLTIANSVPAGSPLPWQIVGGTPVTAAHVAVTGGCAHIIGHRRRNLIDTDSDSDSGLLSAIPVMMSPGRQADERAHAPESSGHTGLRGHCSPSCRPSRATRFAIVLLAAQGLSPGATERTNHLPRTVSTYTYEILQRTQLERVEVPVIRGHGRSPPILDQGLRHRCQTSFREQSTHEQNV